MSRVRLIDTRSETTDTQVEVFDHIASSRGGRMLRPYAAMLHRPEIARITADLGSVIRFSSRLSDRDRELVIATTAIERGCRFEWDAHHPLAVEAGVAASTMEAVEAGTAVTDQRDSHLVEFVRSLCRTGAVDDARFGAVSELLSEEETVELAAVVGFYSMLAVFMNAFDIC